MNSGDSGVGSRSQNYPIMPITYPEYIQLVMDHFDKQRMEKTLSPFLATPTPASIKKECIEVVKKDFDKKDLPIIRTVFGTPDTRLALHEHMDLLNIDRLRPLVNFIKGRTGLPAPASINLLAWLIDYPYRPFELGMNIPPRKEPEGSGGRDMEADPSHPDVPNFASGSQEKGLPGNSATAGSTSDTRKDETGKSVTNDTNEKKRRRTIGLYALIGATALGTGYYILNRGETTYEVQGLMATGCMYWADTAYVSAPCNAKMDGRLLLPLDTEILKRQRKITRPDTITERSIGRIYYIGTKNPIFFTSGGAYPEEVGRSLRKLTKYMFDKHLKKSALSLNSSDSSQSKLP